MSWPRTAVGRTVFQLALIAGTLVALGMLRVEAEIWSWREERRRAS